MTYKEAREYFEMRLADSHSKNRTKQRQAFEMAISAIDMILSNDVEKVLPNGENYIWVLLKTPNQKKIDWSDEP